MFSIVQGKFQGLLATGVWARYLGDRECVLVQLPRRTTGVTAGNTWQGKSNRKGNHGCGKFGMKGGWGNGLEGGGGEGGEGDG